MNRRSLVICLLTCIIGIVVNVLSGCTSDPVPETPPAAEEDVWSLLAIGDGERARAFFLGKTGVNDKDPEGRTPLHFAAEAEDPVLASFFIGMGAEVDALDNSGRTPLDISAEKRDAATAKVIAGAGADIHHTMNSGESPARIAAAERESTEFLSALLHPASVESTDAAGKTVLHLASEAGNARAVDAVLEAGAVLAREDNEGKTAIDLALERPDSRNHAEAAESLILAGAVSDSLLYTYFAPAVRSSNYNIRSADGMAPLHYITREGCLGYLAFMLEKNVDVNIKNASGATPLHEAARAGNIGILEVLLDKGAEINTQDAKGNSPLHIAVPEENHLAAVKLFLARGANPNLRDEHGDSPLHTVIVLNRPAEVIDALLAGGSDVTIRNLDGKTPLYLAVEKGRENYVPLLLSRKSDIFAADNNGLSPFEMALRGNNRMVYSLITNETVFLNDSAGNTVLHITVNAGGNTDVINYILDQNAQVNARNKAGDTSLTIAVRLNEKDAGELLLLRGADIFAANAKGESPLYLAFPASERNTSELRQWVLNPQTLSVRDGLGNTALHYAVQWRFDTWIPLLVKLGAKTENANATGETPLFTAVKHEFPSTIEVLVNNGALFSSRDTLGNSALHAAVRWHAVRGAEKLIDLGLDINCHALNGKTPLHDAIRLGMQDIELLLLKRGSDLEVRDNEGNTPFMEAVLAGSPAVLERLVILGADPVARNYRGDTPLHIAAATERTDIATLLLGWGASIHARNGRGRTPFEDALITSPEMVKTLLTKDRILSSDDNGSSPLHIAVREKARPAVVKTIIDLGARLSPLDSEGRTPLRLAVDTELHETAKLLADSGADVFITARDGKSSAEAALLKGEDAVKALFSGKAISSKDSSGNTVLHYAARQGNAALISLLITLGAKIEVYNIAGESPWDIAVRWNQSEAESLLNYHGI